MSPDASGSSNAQNRCSSASNHSAAASPNRAETNSTHAWIASRVVRAERGSPGEQRQSAEANARRCRGSAEGSRRGVSGCRRAEQRRRFRRSTGAVTGARADQRLYMTGLAQRSARAPPLDRTAASSWAARVVSVIPRPPVPVRPWPSVELCRHAVSPAPLSPRPDDLRHEGGAG